MVMLCLRIPPVHQVEYERLLDDPEGEVRAISDVLGLAPSGDQLQAAIEHVDPIGCKEPTYI